MRSANGSPGLWKTSNRGKRNEPLGREQDVVLDRPVATIDSAMARKHYGAEVYAVGKRRLARRELSQFPIPADLWT
jgi:hypothetical protein